MTVQKLTAKQSKFIDEYLVDLNATQAAARAGYSKNTAYSIGCENLTKPDIQEEIARRQKVLQKKTEVTAERVLAEYAKIGFSNLTDIIDYESGTISIEDFKNLTEGQKHCIKKVKFVSVDRIVGGQNIPTERVELELHDKLKALDSIGRHLGMFDGKTGANDEGQKTIYQFVIGDGKEK